MLYPWLRSSLSHWQKHWQKSWQDSRQRWASPLRSLPHHLPHHPALERHYQALSSASVETLWQTLTNLADMSWHPMITSTDAPQGLIAKPGLIYRVMPRWLPIPVSIFVERVAPQRLMSVRLFPVPGLEERVIYRLESTMLGTRISYSIALRGWLSPLVWSVLKPYAAQVAAAIALAAENPAAFRPPSRSQAW